MKMRKIMCLRISAGLSEELLEACSQHSFLVEPLNEQEILVDLSSFNRIGNIVDDIAGLAASQRKVKAIGVAASPLVAIIASRRLSQTTSKNKTYRQFLCHGVTVIQVLPGKEAEYLSSLPLEEFYILTRREQKLFKRMGYTRVGELANLPVERMSQMLKRDARILGQNCLGIDYTSVRGLYPPECISTSRLFPGGCEDFLQIQEAYQAMSQTLTRELEQRQSACCQVRVEIITASGSLSRERRLTQACSHVIRLEHVIHNLIPSAEITFPVEEVRVVLQGLESVQVYMPDLFSWRRETRTEQRHLQIQDAVDHLQAQYPGYIQIGVRPERREQVLALWDPWRLKL